MTQSVTKFGRARVELLATEGPVEIRIDDQGPGLAHGGTLHLENLRDGGLRAVVRLPQRAV